MLTQQNWMFWFFGGNVTASLVGTFSPTDMWTTYLVVYIAMATIFAVSIYLSCKLYNVDDRIIAWSGWGTMCSVLLPTYTLQHPLGLWQVNPLTITVGLLTLAMSLILAGYAHAWVRQL